MYDWSKLFLETLLLIFQPVFPLSFNDILRLLQCLFNHSLKINMRVSKVWQIAHLSVLTDQLSSTVRRLEHVSALTNLF